MKKTQIYIILLLLLTISCRNVEREKLKIETSKDSSIIEYKNEPKITIENTQPISNSDISEDTSEEQMVKENQNKLKIKFTKIDSTDYFSFKQKYSNGIIIDSTIVHKAGSSFTLAVKNTEEKFSCDIDYNNCNYYIGFLKPLNKYILTYCGRGYCGTYLLDKNTGKTYGIESPFDSECEVLLSINQNKLIAFSTSVFTGDSFIALYKKNDEREEIDFKEFDSFYPTEFSIQEIIWIDNNSIALKIGNGFLKGIIK